MAKYEPHSIESKWQKIWDETYLNIVTDDADKSKKYVLDFFPYPSGTGLHVGHVRNYTISDTYPRYMRMRGYNVLHPMGWDAFGLPAENFAIKTGTSPRQSTDTNKATFKRQMKLMGFSYDWSREIDSSLPEYYHWTQWFFKLLYERGLAYKKEALVNWDPVDKTVLANEQVINGRGERSGALVEKKALNQWFFKITEYADRLLEDLVTINWPEGIKQQQRNWIGRSSGAEIDFEVAGSQEKIRIFTTRLDTIAGATYIVLSPEHPLVEKLVSEDKKAKVVAYIKNAASLTDLDRQASDKRKTGEFIGSHAINPATGQEIPIWIADYVLMGYGTGAIMAVPAHDERDYEFAKEFDLPITRVIQNRDTNSDQQEVYDSSGILQNSGKYDGLTSEQAREEILADLNTSHNATEKVNYRMRDWLISRQRYWGAPIPIIHCEVCGEVAVPDKDLPVVLPELDDFAPSGTGESPLSKATDWVNTTCPDCGGAAKRETDTMDGFACSSWYFLRFADPHNNNEAFSRKQADYWLPVDMYIGGAEHAVMHLLYARFWTKVMYDAGLISFTEPFMTLRNQGMILASDGAKMSKRTGNVITPEDLIDQGYGADTIRAYELFIAPFDQTVPWKQEGLDGVRRFIGKVWDVFCAQATDAGNSEVETELLVAAHKTIKKLTSDLEDFKFNTAVAALMEYVNKLYSHIGSAEISEKVWLELKEILALLLAPIAPHIAEEGWSLCGHTQSVHIAQWPEWDEALLKEDQVVIVVQVNGKLRGQLLVEAGSSAEVLERIVRAENTQQHYTDEEISKIITVPDKIINLVTKR